MSEPPRFLVDEPHDPAASLLFAHGAGAPMDSPFMAAMTAAAVAAGLRVIRFEFAYMAARRDGVRRPPPRAERLVPAFRAALGAALSGFPGPFLIGGKSLGGRVAAMAAGEPVDPRVGGVAVFGYPFHPPRSPEKLRLAPLAAARLPVLVNQGCRDPFGSQAEVATYALPPAVTVVWHDDGDHDLAPRKSHGGRPGAEFATAAAAVRGLAERCARRA